jgi:hypothetical protein
MSEEKKLSLAYVYLVYLAKSKSPKHLAKCEKRAETSVVLIFFKCVLYI